MCWARLNENFCAGTPNHDHAVALLFFFEAVDVFANCVEHATLTADRLDVFALKVARILAFKGSLHGADVAQHIADGFDVLATLKNTSTTGSDIGVVGVDIPSAPDNVFKGG